MKLYFDDPLQAAWMAREFGVVINRVTGMACQLCGNQSYTDLCRYAWLETPHTYYIHPDSYHIFEPQEGDLNVQGLFFEHGVWRAYFGEEVVESYVEKTTIQRNNTAFFMPKDEK